VWERLPGLDGWHSFVAWADGEAAAAGALFVEGDAGWLGAAATRPAFRRRGAQNELLAARIERARELSLRVLAVETGEPVEGKPGGSYRNILRAGFREQYVRANWLSPP
jgi:GNAT superfamily N-acetyltransferase